MATKTVSMDEFIKAHESMKKVYIIGDLGGRVQANGYVQRSSAMPGMVAVETEFGTLYLDEDLPLTVEIS